MISAALKTEEHPTTADVNIAGSNIILLNNKCAYWPDEKLLIVADLHLEKGSSFAKRGQIIPPYDSKSTLTRLAAICSDWQPNTVISLGDSFHDEEGHSRLSQGCKDQLKAIQHKRNWIWITGNHDPNLPKDLEGEHLDAVSLAGILLCHEPTSLAEGPQIAGHLHPAARIKVRGQTLRRSCFALDKNRMILPSFGTYTGGLNVKHPAFNDILSSDTRHIWACTKKAIFPISWDNLKDDIRQY